MIYSQKYLFGLHPCFWNRAPKAFEISFFFLIFLIFFFNFKIFNSYMRSQT